VAVHRISEVDTAVHTLENARTEAADKLRGMVRAINCMQAKTSQVDEWAKKSHNEVGRIGAES
jgi:hypothetical protein